MRRLTDDRGNVVIITALIMTTLFGFLALVIDVGSSLVRRGSLQTGADAAALAIAKRCADAIVSGSTTCTTSIAQGYFDDNLLGGASATLDAPILQTSYAGKVGRITVSGATNQPAYFAPLLGFSSTQTVRASATARWGPLTAEDAVFPIALCKGALPPVGGTATFIFDPADTSDPQDCDGNDSAQPYGWIAPDDPAACTAKVTLLPSSTLTVAAPDAPPAGAGCDAAVDDLIADLRYTSGAPPKWAGSANDRTRVLAVYDAAAGLGNQHPSYSLIAFEFTGVRFGPGWWNEANGDPGSEVCNSPEVCIRGVVRNWTPPSDGPIFDPALAAALPNIDDTTVLDVRLVD